METKTAHIFLVEDNLADVLLIKEALRRRKIAYEIDHYPTAPEAIRALSDRGEGTSVPDLVLLDQNVPGGQGLDVLAAVAQNPHMDGVPRALLSSFLLPEERERAKQLGAATFISKPSDLNSFLSEVGAMVENLLEKTHEPRPL